MLCATLLLIFTQACTDSKGQKQEEPVFKQVPEIQEIKPEKTVKIKLKRNAKDDYSWEINGDDAEEVVNADKRLKKGLKTE
jgi:predicted secreted protein